jgi:hypothetical protein
VNFDPGAHVFNAFEFAFKFGCDNASGRGVRRTCKMMLLRREMTPSFVCP